MKNIKSPYRNVKRTLEESMRFSRPTVEFIDSSFLLSCGLLELVRAVEKDLSEVNVKLDALLAGHSTLAANPAEAPTSELISAERALQTITTTPS